jgi:uncharacterized protein (TIGR03083 family)
MQASDILKYGTSFFQGTLDGVPDSEWSTPDVCGVWSVKDIVAHLASYENLLSDILADFPDVPSSVVQTMMDPYAWNDEMVASRRDKTREEVLAEYNEGHARNLMLIAKVTPDRCREVGLLPWYGTEYSLDDFLVYSFYGHKREHGAQVNVFKDVLKQRAAMRSK